MRSSRPFRAIVILMGLGSLHAATALADDESRWWERLLSPGLRQTEERYREQKAELAARLSSTGIAQPVAEVGYLSSVYDPAKTPAPWVQIDLGRVRRLQRIALLPAELYWEGGESSRHYGFPIRFRLECAMAEDFAEPALLADHTQSDCLLPAAGPWISPRFEAAGRYVRLTVERGRLHPTGQRFFAIGEFMVIAEGENAAPGCAVEATYPLLQPPQWAPEYLVDGRSALGPTLEPVHGLIAGLNVRGKPKDMPRMVLDLPHAAWVDEIRLHPMHGQHSKAPGLRFPSHPRITAASEAQDGQSVTLFEPPERGVSNPGNNPFIIRLPAPVEVSSVTITQTRSNPGPGWAFALSEIELLHQGQHIEREATVSLLPEMVPTGKDPQLMVDGYISGGRLLSAGQWLDGWRQTQRLMADVAALATQISTLRSTAWLNLGIVAALLAVIAIVSAFLWRDRLHDRYQSRVEEMKQQLARDLHDEIGSNMAALNMLSEVARMTAQKEQHQDWEEASRLARDSTTAMRDVLWLIGTRAESGTTLDTQLHRTAQRILHGIQVKWEVALPAAPLPVEIQRQIALCFREALANITRHSSARQVTISTQMDATTLTLSIRDDGTGFDADNAEKAGVGLTGMKRRMRDIGGTFTLHSHTGEGTEILLTLPVPTSKPT